MKLRDLIYLNKSDRNSVIILVVVVVAVLTVLVLNDDEPQRMDKEDDRKEYVYPKKHVYKSSNAGVRQADDMPIDCGEERHITLRKFDPNTADSTTLLELGLSRWQVRNIYKYRARGGIYRKKSDFAKLYGLTVKQYRTIEPYIVISEDYAEASTLFEEEKRDTVKYPEKIKEGEHVYLNLADTAQLKKVPGIGSGYARAIISYGQRLGGYVRVEQLMEIDGFPEESLQYFELKPVPVKKLNINRLSVSKMQRHPYITFFMARAIADYRRLNGPLTDISQLRLNKEFTPDVISRLRDYIEY